jgi:hypothetical protein
MFAGAPGFCINKLTGNVTDVDWSEYQDTILNGKPVVPADSQGLLALANCC